LIGVTAAIALSLEKAISVTKLKRPVANAPRPNRMPERWTGRRGSRNFRKFGEEKEGRTSAGTVPIRHTALRTELSSKSTSLKIGLK
jgi:hypothetical protein